MAPVGNCLVDEVSDKDDLRAPEMIASPQKDPGKEEKVVQNEVGGDIGGCRDEDLILGEEVPDVAELGKEQKDPE